MIPYWLLIAAMASLAVGIVGMTVALMTIAVREARKDHLSGRFPWI
ncbi:hypothetical protein G8E10_09450 [Rhizobiaceae bacterium CRRU44]|uniref:Uncharacterized protein n=1 Tax=Ferranicluibacter rubi TaxID=2715133 RepID=A0AA44CAK2_9HYPH|nr:hypothetical protein [Ferranicluibacter rubi]NHT75904.1 hypothetical protein [Ferranicluibacter rubi]NHT75964.1 hypothetical protein [Ferranicluibacter rubi]